MQRGLLLLKAGVHGNAIRVLSPLVITDAELDEALGGLGRRARARARHSSNFGGAGTVAWWWCASRPLRAGTSSKSVVGTGGMSSVYCAFDTLLERNVALKVLHEQYGGDEEYVERFRREARSVAQLSHPNIVTVIDRGDEDGKQFIVFEVDRGREPRRSWSSAAGRCPCAARSSSGSRSAERSRSRTARGSSTAT